MSENMSKNDRIEVGSYAEAAAEAWARPSGFSLRARSAARTATLRAASLKQRGQTSGKFVRCLYGHAVFPDCEGTLRTFVKTLKSEGEFIDTATLLDILSSETAPDGAYFHMSFDDGFANVVENGGEVFEAEKVPYTVFVATDLVEAPPKVLMDYFVRMDSYVRPIRTLTWDEIRATKGTLCEIGCHTQSHARLSDISGDSALLKKEIGEAKDIIERELGERCTSFAWPYGTDRDIDETALAAIVEADFEICFSAVRGRIQPATTSNWRVPRHQVEFHWPMHELLLWARGYRE